MDIGTVRKLYFGVVRNPFLAMVVQLSKALQKYRSGSNDGDAHFTIGTPPSTFARGGVAWTILRHVLEEGEAVDANFNFE
eukprot:3561958-Pyramimonas_sp.AAC.1